jgi:hypothetical protein
VHCTGGSTVYLLFSLQAMNAMDNLIIHILANCLTGRADLTCRIMPTDLNRQIANDNITPFCYRNCRENTAFQMHTLNVYREVLFIKVSLNIASGSYSHISTLCEKEFVNFLWLIWVHYLPLQPHTRIDPLHLQVGG